MGGDVESNNILITASIFEKFLMKMRGEATHLTVYMEITNIPEEFTIIGFERLKSILYEKMCKDYKDIECEKEFGYKKIDESKSFVYLLIVFKSNKESDVSRSYDHIIKLVFDIIKFFADGFHQYFQSLDTNVNNDEYYLKNKSNFEIKFVRESLKNPGEEASKTDSFRSIAERELMYSKNIEKKEYYTIFDLESIKIERDKCIRYIQFRFSHDIVYWYLVLFIKYEDVNNDPKYNYFLLDLENEPDTKSGKIGEANASFLREMFNEETYKECREKDGPIEPVLIDVSTELLDHDYENLTVPEQNGSHDPGHVEVRTKDSHYDKGQIVPVLKIKDTRNINIHKGDYSLTDRNSTVKIAEPLCILILNDRNIEITTLHRKIHFRPDIRDIILVFSTPKMKNNITQRVEAKAPAYGVKFLFELICWIDKSKAFYEIKCVLPKEYVEGFGKVEGSLDLE